MTLWSESCCSLLPRPAPPWFADGVRQAAAAAERGPGGHAALPGGVLHRGRQWRAVPQARLSACAPACLLAVRCGAACRCKPPAPGLSMQASWAHWVAVRVGGGGRGRPSPAWRPVRRRHAEESRSGGRQMACLVSCSFHAADRRTAHAARWRSIRCPSLRHSDTLCTSKPRHIYSDTFSGSASGRGCCSAVKEARLKHPIFGRTAAPNAGAMSRSSLNLLLALILTLGWASSHLVAGAPRPRKHCAPTFAVIRTKLASKRVKLPMCAAAASQPAPQAKVTSAVAGAAGSRPNSQHFTGRPMRALPALPGQQQPLWMVCWRPAAVPGRFQAASWLKPPRSVSRPCSCCLDCLPLHGGQRCLLLRLARHTGLLCRQRPHRGLQVRRMHHLVQSCASCGTHAGGAAMGCAGSACRQTGATAGSTCWPG